MDSSCKNQMPSNSGQSNPSFYVLNSCTPLAGGDSSFRSKVTCLNGVIYVSVYADSGCTVKVYGGDQGYPNDVCVQQAGGSLLVKSDNCSSILASPPPTSTAFNATVTAYTDSACKNSTPPSASQQNPSVYVSNVCTPVPGGGGYVKFTSCVSGKIVYSVYSDAACANKLAEGVSTNTNTCTNQYIFDCSFNPISNSADAPTTSAAAQEIDVERNWFLLSFRTRHLCSEQLVRTRDCLLKNASFPAGKLNFWLLLTPVNVVFFNFQLLDLS